MDRFIANATESYKSLNPATSEIGNEWTNIGLSLAVFESLHARLSSRGLQSRFCCIQACTGARARFHAQTRSNAAPNTRRPTVLEKHGQTQSLHRLPETTDGRKCNGFGTASAHGILGDCIGTPAFVDSDPEADRLLEWGGLDRHVYGCIFGLFRSLCGVIPRSSKIKVANTSTVAFGHSW
ncbi:hypothetical protein OPT61_g3779 [Boeremia exigua]|uniref:Uncharacterized protein n=1 Tax=Boeremia exigua TaxID=749465 RepID=A0ACC2IGU7_9PLEO|nr:hypothetical protein OPT61_g3779 [Boeremia exigua]